MNQSQNNQPAVSRRQFIKTSSLAAGVVAATAPFVLTSHAAPDDPIRVGIIGCGGRGGGAGKNAEAAAPNVKVIGIADIFPDQVDKAKQNFPGVNPDYCFSGFDAYEKLLKVPEINYVILGTPPGFRPIHFAAAIAAGKHVFMEKPVATDVPGIKMIYQAGEQAAQKKLCVVAGTQRRHSANYIETIKRIHDGAIGDIIYTKAYWNQGAIWHRGDQGETDMEKQIRNWYHYVWLSGDHIVEQHVHNIDISNWVMKAHPIRAVSGVGGRHALGNKSGHIFDHFAVEFEYPNGARLFSQCCQITGKEGNVSEFAVGTKGTSNCQNWILAEGQRWRSSAKSIDAYVQEHTDLITAIRTGQYVNEAQTVADSTLTAIMGREATYCGKAVRWDDLLKEGKALVPKTFAWGPAPKVEVAYPNSYKWEAES